MIPATAHTSHDGQSYNVPWISFDDRLCMQCSHIFFLPRWMSPCSGGATLVFVWRWIPSSCWHHSSQWQHGGGRPASPRPLAPSAFEMQAVDWLLSSAEMFTERSSYVSVCTRSIPAMLAVFASPIGVLLGLVRRQVKYWGLGIFGWSFIYRVAMRRSSARVLSDFYLFHL